MTVSNPVFDISVAGDGEEHRLRRLIDVAPDAAVEAEHESTRYLPSTLPPGLAAQAPNAALVSPAAAEEPPAFLSSVSPPAAQPMAPPAVAAPEPVDQSFLSTLAPPSQAFGAASVPPMDNLIQAGPPPSSEDLSYALRNAHPPQPVAPSEPDFFPAPPAQAEHPAPAWAKEPAPTVATPSTRVEGNTAAAVQPPAGGSTPFASERDKALSPDADLEEALQKVLMTSGSDLHITVNAPPMIRVDGALKPIAGAPVWSTEKVTAALHSILTPAQRAIFETALEFDFAYTLSANARFRVNFYQQRNNIGAAFRLIPTEIKNLRDLGVPEVIGNFAKLARGLVLVTGPTGSGKSTTLAGLIDVVNRTRADHIMTVEDPIEFLHQNHKSLVNQREVGHDTHSFAAALKHVLRQDPDVILVGELRDLETISVALTAAETGHLVFATLHTQSAPQTIDRIIDVYPPHQQGQVRAQLAATLQGVVCQTLVKKASGSGRVVATEVLVGTHAVANLIREGKTYQVHSAMQAGRDLGMHTMDQHLADLVNTGEITYEAAVEKAQDLEVLKRLVSRTDAPASFGDGTDFGDKFSMGY